MLQISNSDLFPEHLNANNAFWKLLWNKQRD